MADFSRCFPALARQVVPLLVEIRQHVRSLKQDVDAVRSHVLQLEAASQQAEAPLPGPVALPSLLSDLPLRTLPDVQEAERLLADVSVRQALKVQLLGKGSKALQRCVQILVRLLLTNDLQRNYSLAGRQKKRAFKELRMGKILLAAVEEKTGQDSDSVEKAVGRYLAGAPARAKEAKERGNGNRALQDEPEVSRETRRRGGTAVALKMELPQVQSEAVSTGTELDGSSGSTAMTAVAIKTEPAEFVEEDEEPSSHLGSVTSEPE
ncbi:uncharacterized protein LOC8027361 isoform X2 [Ixodes scapularis]|uniref:uncharacterized protein LOC8027361 isoform X2 n=1 Tax=Ixodes scapularis TaxID=6945 RepID=UPI001C393667|nr:uncharacterized protein LOC8027361 isoform X2 [Ixodes scapularis]XP_042142428.1 uncharacterized protein LOC8027361 isoform X2 [Ixodes scapularis]